MTKLFAWVGYLQAEFRLQVEILSGYGARVGTSEAREAALEKAWDAGLTLRQLDVAEDQAILRAKNHLRPGTRKDADRTFVAMLREFPRPPLVNRAPKSPDVFGQVCDHVRRYNRDSYDMACMRMDGIRFGGDKSPVNPYTPKAR